MRSRIETTVSSTRLPVMSLAVLPAERMARNICNALSLKFDMEMIELRKAAFREVLSDRRKGSPWSIGYPPNEDDFEKGLAYALSCGWVSECEGRVHLTPTGADAANRLRMSRRR